MRRADPLPAAMLQRLFVSIVLVLTAASARAQERVQRGPPPDWVQPIEFDASAARTDSGSLEYLLIDLQENAARAPFESYVHVAKRVLNGAGVESESEVGIEFDPSFQEIAVHSVAVHRDGTTLDQLASQDFQVIQRESGLERLVHDGVHTALLILHDVRSGDVIEYSFTTRGRTTAFGAKYVSAKGAQSSVPIARLRWRVLWPDGRELHARPHGLEVQPKIEAFDGGSEWLWDLRDCTPLDVDGQEPGWYEVAPWIQTSEFADWGEVADSVRELFTLPDDCGPEVRAVADGIRAQSPDATEQARLALRFVQREVRYLAINFGEGAYRPRAPREVLARRFGDCKDKVVLLIAILRELAIPAEAALVNTSAREHVSEWLPTPMAFDHAIARVHVGGASLWVDPTLTYERGPLTEGSLADYGVALCWSADARGLVPFERKSGDEPRIRVVRTVRVDGRRGATLDLETTYEGAEATSFRAYVDATAREQLEKGWLEYRAGDYTAIATREPLELEDDEARNRIVMREHYQVPNLWTEKDEDGTWANFGASEIQAELVTPDVTRRTAPLGLPFPKHVTCDTTVHLPDHWPIDASKTRVRDPAFAFDVEIRVAQRRIDLHFDYRTLADHVPAADCQRYIANLERVEDNLAYQIVSPDVVQRAQPLEASVAENAGIALAVLGVWAALIVGVVKLSSRRHSRELGLRPATSSPGTTLTLVKGDSPFEQASARSVWSEGDVLVLARGASLPPRCVLCNRPSSTLVRRRFSWHEPGLYVLVILGVLLYIIVAACVSRRATVEMGLCGEHTARRTRKAWIATGLALCGLASVGLACTSEPLAGPLCALGGTLLLAAIVVGSYKRSVLKPVRIGEREIELRGAGDEFLRAL